MSERRAVVARAVVGAVVGVVVLLALVFAVWPLLVLVLRGVGLGSDGGASSAALAAVARGENLRALLESVLVSVGAVVVAVVVGVPAAVVVERTDVWGKRLLAALCALPLAVPPYIFAFAFRALYDDKIGLLPLPARLFHLDVDSRVGIAVVMGVSFLPLVFLRVRASLAQIDGALEEAARIAGASPVRALVDHTLPLTFPTLLSSMALVLVASLASWGVPVLLGLAADPPVVVVTARIGVALSGGQLQEAIGLSLALAALAGVAFAIPAWLTKKTNVVVIAGKAARPQVLALGAARGPVSVVVWGVSGALLVGPLLALVLQALLRTAGGGVSLTNLSLTHVVAVLDRVDVQDAAVASVVLAVVAAAIVVGAAVVVGAVGRVGDNAGVARAVGVVSGVAEVVYAVPGTIVAVALVLAFSSEVRLVLLERVSLIFAVAGTLWLVLIAYVIKHAALGLRAVAEALRQVHPSLEEAARMAGARPAQAFAFATLPLLRGHLVAAAIAVALPCFSELTMSVLLQAPGTRTLGVVLFSLYEYGNPQQAMALAAVLVVVVAAGQLAVARLRAR